MKLDAIAQAYQNMLAEQFEMLTENRVQWLKDNTKEVDTSHDPHGEHKTKDAIIDHFATHADPTKKNVHTQYIMGLYNNKKIRQEDAGRVHDVLSNFEKYKNRLSPDEKQLNLKRYPSIADVQKTVAPHLGQIVSKSAAQEQFDQPGHTNIYEDDHIKLYKLTGKEASKNLYGGGVERGGCGTAWCTAARSDRNMFDHYTEKGTKPLWVVHRKSDGAVFQYHPTSNQFMDRDDNEISEEDLHSVLPHLHNAWDKHPEALG